jgi:NADPH:quinone reductase-like Zn-dependent oxidoreductase/short-subunit dehydrogenase
MNASRSVSRCTYTTQAREINAHGGTAFAVHCDVTDASSQQTAFERHLQKFGGLHAVALNAGIMESGDLFKGSDDAWKRTFRVNLEAVMVGVRLAVRSMVDFKTPGAILIMASAGGIFPMPMAPVYSVSKAGCVALTRSLGPVLQKRFGITLTALCPQFTDTALVRSVTEQRGAAVSKELMREVDGRLLTVDQVAAVAEALLRDKTKAGECVVVLANGGLAGVAKPRLTKMFVAGMTGQPLPEASGAYHEVARLRSQLPAEARKIIVRELSTNFREATEICSFAIPSSLPPGTVLIKNLYVGVNASDINFTSGRYQAGGPSAAAKALPFDAGFEACGIVVAIASNVRNLAVGQPVATMQFGGFAEYAIVPAKQAMPVPRAAPEIVALLTSGLTASIALEQAARLESNETVLVTAAAGGTGQFFVQLAKAAGNRVVATCGSDDKAALLRSLGADRVINYNKENVKDVLKAEFPAGIDVVCELVGGEMFKTCLDALAIKGRLVIIGAISQYVGGWSPSTHVGLPEKLLSKSAALVGFFLPLYAKEFRRHIANLVRAWESGTLKVSLDPLSKEYRSLEAVPDAVDRLQSGKSLGKVYVRVNGGAAAKL